MLTNIFCDMTIHAYVTEIPSETRHVYLIPSHWIQWRTTVPSLNFSGQSGGYNVISDELNHMGKVC